ncbi:hypothetical protein EVAR_18634_1 [Eumeta japonica]|uniref:Uncharacterized protein n=1 Tax=Eumeta variegata TaxID=151549 RepID=A0A4C1U6J0_EUMVA|nr:hypothetical protein EVAR_18634_1 [Eumeta japonica]
MNSSATTVNGAVNGTNGALNCIGAAPRTATLGTPSSYAYTSSGSLLGRGASVRPVPPPTLPKYSGSFSAGSTGLRERDREGSGGSHRLASLERLALRQRIIEQNANNQVPNAPVLNPTAAVGEGPTFATVTLTDTAAVSPGARRALRAPDTTHGTSPVIGTHPAKKRQHKSLF